ncbi:MAG: sugar transferase [Phycisphaerae bacterium]|nr:sugar transferase [Phycisphaerae bacterium]
MGDNLLQFAVSREPVASLVLDGLSKNLWLSSDTNTAVAVPKEWNIEPQRATPEIVRYEDDVPFNWEALRKAKRDSWFVVSNGQFATRISSELFHKVLAEMPADVIAVNAKAELLAYREKIILASRDRVAGYRRCYLDFVEPVSVPDSWPHHIFVRAEVVEFLMAHDILHKSFSCFVRECLSNSLELHAINVAGTALDLGAEEGLLSFCKTKLNFLTDSHFPANGYRIYDSVSDVTGTISGSARLMGKVLLGKDVHIGPNVIIVGPTIIGNNVRIGQGAVINSSIICSNISVPQNQLLQSKLVKEAQCDWKRLAQYKSNGSKQVSFADLNCRANVTDVFRIWPRFSYAGCFKRIADYFAATIVLILFAPVVPFIALAIKLNSSGPVFFKDKRQGLHGKEFYCLKFRTMTVGADKIQDKLRVVNQTDGPQFKMEDDPRVDVVGRFLRDTYIDEIPQFFNVLLGQMSLVGPRPSPESENTLCPSWRDARLSVRPGVTGLWQICRTRQPMKDFQEWIYYDTKYVRELSLKMDIWICWKTVKKMLRKFVGQF